MDPLGSIIVVLQFRGTSLAQNPIKGAKRKNRPPTIYGPEVQQILQSYTETFMEKNCKLEKETLVFDTMHMYLYE